jgi:chromate reductase, NAD(P)H dehydrogenase (quinone)
MSTDETKTTSSTNVRCLALCGSVRSESFNGKLLQEAARAARQRGMQVTFVDLRELALPFYDGDLEQRSGMPDAAKRFRQMLVDSNAVMIASPEHNGSVTAVLKNALDWATRSEQGQPAKDAFQNKTFALLSTSPSPYGGSRSLANLRIILGNVGSRILDQQVSVGSCFKSFDAQGHLVDAGMQEQVEQLVHKLATDCGAGASDTPKAT